MSTETEAPAVWLDPLHLCHVLVVRRGDPPAPGLLDMLGSFWTEADLLDALNDWARDAMLSFQPIFDNPTQQAAHYAAVLMAQMAREAWHVLIARAKMPPGHRWAAFPHFPIAYHDDPAASELRLSDPALLTADISLLVCWTCGERLTRPAVRHGADCVVCAAEWIDTCRNFAARHRNG